MRSSLASRAASGDSPVAGRRGTLLIPFVLACAVLADRAQVGVVTGGRGVLPLLAIVAPLAGLVTVTRYGSGRSLRFLAHPTFVLTVLPYLALTALFPILGIIFNRFPERTLLSVTEATTALSFLVIGAALSSSRDASWSRWILVAVTLQLAYAVGQTIYLLRGPGWELFVPFHEWDVSGQDPNVFVQGRSGGLYLNPNVLGFWAAAAVILSWTMVSPRLRWIGVALGVLTLLLSQSRGAAAALVAVLALGVVLAIPRGGIFSSKALNAVLSFGFAGLLAVAAVSMLDPQGALGERFGALTQIWAEGPRADPNLAGRLDFWAAAIELNMEYPWGTWGSPELLLGTAIDSTWVRAFVQGSVLYVAALALLIIAAFSVGWSAYRPTLRLLTVLVAVAALTQTPFGYPVIVVFWVLLGAGLQSSVPGRVPAPAARAKLATPSIATRAGASGHPR